MRIAPSFSSTLRSALLQLWAPAQAWVNWCIGWCGSTAAVQPVRALQGASALSVPQHRLVCHSARPRRSTRLKIVREFEQGIHASCAGRMVISGRMADVCAELERMSHQTH